MKRLLAGILVIGLMTTVGLNTVSQAEGPEHEHHRGHGKHFAKMDTNGDGVIDKQEVRKKAEEHFAKMDTNGDSVIDKEEGMAKVEAHFAKMDANGDGKITKEESKSARKNFRRKMKRCDLRKDQ